MSDLNTVGTGTPQFPANTPLPIREAIIDAIRHLAADRAELAHLIESGDSANNRRIIQLQQAIFVQENTLLALEAKNKVTETDPDFSPNDPKRMPAHGVLPPIGSRKPISR